MSNIFPIKKKLSESKNVLLLGMGGGYDCFTGVPLYFDLKNHYKNIKHVFMGNLSFTSDLITKAKRRYPNDAKDDETFLFEVHYSDYVKDKKCDDFHQKLGFPKNYFPEFHLSKWFYNYCDKSDVGVLAFNLKKSTKPFFSIPAYSKALQHFVDIKKIDTIILVDAGVDSILKGDEEGIGTIGEDLMSIFALKNVKVKKKLLMCVGLGTEGDISIFDFFENMSEIKRNKGFYGSCSMLQQNDSVKKYIHAIKKSCPINTTINNCIIAAIEGNYGHYSNECLMKRKVYSVFIHPMMCIVYYFNVDVVINMKLFVEKLEKSTSLTNFYSKFEVARAVKGITDKMGKYCGKRKYKNIEFNK